MKLCPQCGIAYPNDFQVCPRDQSPLQLASDLVPGMEIRNKWIILNKIGAGGMATVYRVKHRAFGSIRAIKVIDARLAEDERFVKRFHAEAVLAQKLDHPNIIRIEDLDSTEDGRPFIVMECVEGRSLRDLICQQGMLPIERALPIAGQVASALGAAHRMGIVHRDIKPDNILITQAPAGSDVVKVTDFGIAKAAHGSAAGTHTFGTETGAAIGTPAYMSPEQVLGLSDQIDARTDIYSLCIALYEMLTGELPFKSDTPMGLALSRVNTFPIPPQQACPQANLPTRLCDLVMKGLERERERRYQSAEELMQAIRTCTPGPRDVLRQPSGRTATVLETRSPKQPEQPPLAPSPPKRKNATWAIVGIAAFAVCALVGIWLYASRTPTPSSGNPSPGSAAPSSQSENSAPNSAAPSQANTASKTNSLPSYSADEVEEAPTRQQRERAQSLVADGERQWADGNYDASETSFKAALKLDPNNAQAAAGLKKAQKGKADEQSALQNAR